MKFELVRDDRDEEKNVQIKVGREPESGIFENKPPYFFNTPQKQQNREIDPMRMMRRFGGS